MVTSSDSDVREPVGAQLARRYGKYVLVRKLAEGGMAEIFLAKQVGVEGFEKNVVIKRMLSHLSEVPDFVSMFLDEARLAATLAHPNIVQISDLGHADGCYYICMEYLAGEDFSTVLRTARRRVQTVPLNVTLKVIADAARGLHYAHTFTDATGRALNVVHRDISPANLFVTYNGVVKVLDFGIAKAETRVTQTSAGVLKGKYQYMSPEQAESGPVDRRADIYSLGVSLYEALTGERPFARDSDLAILNAVLKHTYKPILEARPDLSPELAQIVTRAMAHNPDARHQTADELATDLERFLGASTSATGGQALATFMTGFFGPERVLSKTRIATLESITIGGPGPPGPDASAGAEPGTRLERTPTIGAPRSVVTHRRQRRVGQVAAALVLLASVAGITWYLARPTQPAGAEVPVPVPTVVAPVAVTQPKPEADAGAAFDAGAAEAVAAVVDPEPVETGRPRVKAVTLTEKSIGQVVQRSSGGFQRCFTTHRAALPAESGKYLLALGIAKSGKVTMAKAEPSEGAVPRCLEQHARGLRFPLNTNGPFEFALPLRYTVKGAP